ncbi:MAG: hypothetical protein QW156_01960 [Candidatus Aenigmatarchaeota archaeon]
MQIKFYLLLFISYLLFTFILTYPSILNFQNLIGYEGWLEGNYTVLHGDAWQNIWNMWLVRKKIFDLDLTYYTDYQFYPFGTKLTFHTLTLFPALIALPIYYLVNNWIFAYNVIVILNFVLAGFTMFFLVNYLVKNKWIAFISSYAFTFSPYHLTMSTNYLNLATIFALPLYVLFFIKFWEEKFNFKNLFLLPLSLFLVFLSDLQYLFFMLLFSFLSLPFLIFKKVRNELKGVGLKIIFLLIAVLPIVPFVQPVISDYYGGFGQVGLESIKTKNLIAFQNYFLNHANILFGEFFIRFVIPGLESHVFIGYVVLFFSLFYVVYKFKQSLLWIFLISIFIILSLGPEMFIGNKKIISPIYKFFYDNFPFFKAILHPSRFAIMVILFSIILFAKGLKEFSIKVKNKNIFFPIIFLVIFLEYLQFPFYSDTNLNLDKSFISFLKDIKTESNITILGIPARGSYYDFYFTTIHEKKLISGPGISRVDPKSTKYLSDLSILISQNKTEEIKNILNSLKTKYIFVYKSYKLKNFLKDYNAKFNELERLPLILSLRLIYKSYWIEIYENTYLNT